MGEHGGYPSGFELRVTEGSLATNPPCSKVLEALHDLINEPRCAKSDGVFASSGAVLDLIVF